MDSVDKRYTWLQCISVDEIQMGKYNDSRMRQQLHTNHRWNMDLVNKHLWFELIECIRTCRFHFRCILEDKYKKCRIDFAGKLLAGDKRLGYHIDYAHLTFEYNIGHRLYIQTDKGHTLTNP